MDGTNGVAVLAAAEAMDVEQLPAIREARHGVDVLRDQADRALVTDAISAQTATALLGDVVRARQAAERQRLELTRPLNTVVKRINAAATATLEPLKTIEAALKRKLLTYQAEQERKAAAERIRLEAEAEIRREQEAERLRVIEEAARADRERAARAVAAAEAAERAARAERARSRMAAMDEIEADLAPLADDALQAVADSVEGDRAEIARTMLAARRRAETLRVAQEQEKAARAAETAARAMPALPINAPAVAPPPRLSGGGASISVRKRWTYTVEDLDAVPAAYKSLNLGAVQRAINSGARDIPGLRIFSTTDAAVHA